MNTTGVAPFRGIERFERVWRGPFRPANQGVPRTELAVPVSPTGALSDAVLYEQPKDVTARLHLPRWRIRTRGASYDIRATEAAGRWVVRFGVEPYPAPELDDDGVRTPALPHTVPSATLSYSAPPLVRTLAAAELIPDDAGLLIGFDVDLPGLDEILWAMASEGGIRLSLSRSFTVAVPVVQTSPEQGSVFQFIADKGFVRVRHAIPEPPSPEPVVEPERGKPWLVGRLGGQLGMQLRVNQAFDVLHARPAARVNLSLDAPLGDIQIAGGDAGTPRAVRSRALEHAARYRDLVFDPGAVVVAQPVEQASTEVVPEVRFREAPTVLTFDIMLRLRPEAHPEIFSRGEARQPRSRSVRVAHGGRSHVYFQDESRPGAFYFLPDRYGLARTQSLPLRPAMVFRVDQGEEEAEATTAWTFQLRPVLDHDRLEAATVELRKLVPRPPDGEPEPEVTLEPVQADAELTLALPPGAVLEKPAVDLVNGFFAAVVFPFAAFQDVFAALAAADEIGTLLRGTVDVELGDDDGPSQARALIPVDLRFSAADNAVLTMDESPTADGGVALTLRNGSESPVRVDALPLRIARGESTVSATAKGLTLPLELAAGAETTFVVEAAEPLPGEGDLDVMADLSAVVPLPDAAAILALTLDQRVAQVGSRTVTVLTTTAKLAGVDPVNDILVEFEGSTEAPVHLSAQQLQVQAEVPVPLADVLLRRASAPYRFRQTVLRASGDQQDAQWRTSNSSLLVVPVA